MRSEFDVNGTSQPSFSSDIRKWVEQSSTAAIFSLRSYDVDIRIAFAFAGSTNRALSHRGRPPTCPQVYFCTNSHRKIINKNENNVRNLFSKASHNKGTPTHTGKLNKLTKWTISCWDMSQYGTVVGLREDQRFKSSSVIEAIDAWLHSIYSCIKLQLLTGNKQNNNPTLPRLNALKPTPKTTTNTCLCYGWWLLWCTHVVMYTHTTIVSFIIWYQLAL